MRTVTLFLFVQAGNQTGRVVTVAARLLYFAVELVRQLRHGQVAAVALGFGEADTQVLAHQVDRKTEIELAFDHGLAAVFQLPRLGRALGYHIDHAASIEARILGKGDAFAERLHQARDTDLVDHLGQLARTRDAHIGDSARKQGDHGL